MPLTQDEIDSCKDAFLAFDKDRSGTIDVWELRSVRVVGAVAWRCLLWRGERGMRGDGGGVMNWWRDVLTCDEPGARCRCWRQWAKNPQKRSCFR